MTFEEWLNLSDLPYTGAEVERLEAAWNAGLKAAEPAAEPPEKKQIFIQKTLGYLLFCAFSKARNEHMSIHEVRRQWCNWDGDYASKPQWEEVALSFTQLLKEDGWRHD